MKIAYHPRFIRQYRRMPNDLKAEIREKIELFEQNHNYPALKTHKLQGKLKGDYAFSVNYAYRIIFRMPQDEALFLEIGTHDIYK